MSSTQTFHDLVPSQLRASWSASGIYPDVPVFQLFERHAQADPDRIAVIDADGPISYGNMRELALRLAAGLVRLGISEGDVIACQLPNSRYSCLVDLAVAAIGAIVLPFPVGRGHRDIQSLLATSHARGIVITAKHYEFDVLDAVLTLRPQLPALEHILLQDAIIEHLADHPLGAHQLPTVDPNSVVRLLVSSGSEAAPKLVAYSHNALVGGRGQFLARLQRPGRPMRAMFLVPLGSSFGSYATFGVLCTLGGSLVLPPEFSASETLWAVEHHRPTHLLGVSTMFQRLLASPLLAETDVSSLDAVVSGGAIIDPPTAARCASELGCAFISLYGSADGVNCHTLLDDDISVSQHTLGTPNPSVCAIRIVDENEADLPTGEQGEILGRGPMSPHCYVNAPDLDAQHRTSDGWVRTGDLGYLDQDGRLRLAGRKKDIIIRGGANLSPSEVEAAIAEHPEVTGVVCFGVADADLGQRLCAGVTLTRARPPLTLPKLVEFLRANGLETRKLPEFLVVCEEFPLTPAGKVDKPALLAQLAGQACFSHPRR